MPAMILCAGLGTRLRPLSADRPKALVPVGDRTVLEHVVARIGPGSEKVVANAHHKARVLREFVRNHDEMRVRSIVVVQEEELLGTAGGLAHAAAELGTGDVLVWNGDILADVDGTRLLAAHGASRARATLAVKLGRAGEGNVGMDGDGRVVRLRAETVHRGEVMGGWFAAIHVVGSSLREGLPSKGCLVGDVYLPALRRGEDLRGLAIDAFTDIGDLASYVDANEAWLAARGQTAWAGEGAKVAGGVRLSRTVVGKGAVVEGEGSLARCVVWAGARAVAPLADAIVLPDQTVTLASVRPSPS